MNHSVRTPAYDTYTKPTCNLCITSKPALTVYQMPTQLCSLSPRSQFRIRTQLFLRLFLMRFFYMCYPPLPFPLSLFSHLLKTQNTSSVSHSAPSFSFPISFADSLFGSLALWLTFKPHKIDVSCMHRERCRVKAQTIRECKCTVSQ